tara:strand:- start:680 stop:1024 length:345 start_codon:yes stop_codon:yes gene_type:complete
MHVGRDGASVVAQRGNPHVLFSGETYRGQFSMNKSEGLKFQEREKREADKDDDSGSESEHEEHTDKKKRIYKKGEDADKDGKVGEGKKKVADFSSKDRDDIPDAFQKKHKKDKD